MQIKSPLQIKNSQHFCILPWIHAHILPDSTVLPCCVSDFKQPYGKIKNKPLKTIWNDSSFKEMRQKMLSDQPVSSCHNCYELEAGQIESMRQRMNRDFIHHAPLLEQTTSDGEFSNIDMKYLDIRFSNLCNFKCRSCSPFCSSQWFDDYQKLWGENINHKKLVRLHDSSPQQQNSLAEQLESLEVAYFAGGEPLMMEEHYYCLEKLIQLKKDIPIHYNTNLSVLSFKNYDLIQLWKNFSRIDLNISLDDIEERGEYFRHGLSWKKFRQNLMRVKAELPHARFQITCTVTLFNIHRLPIIHQTMLELGIIDSTGFTLNPLQEPRYYRTQVLPRADKHKIKTSLTSYIKKLESADPTQDWSFLKNSLQGIITTMEKADQSHQLPTFQQVTRKLDLMRGESFQNIYPELSHLMQTKTMALIPLHNQEIRLQPLMREIEHLILPECDLIFFVDENSTDKTQHVLNLELPKLKQPHKFIKIDRHITRGETFRIAYDYAKEQGIDYILSFEEGWQDCVAEFLSVVKTKEYQHYDLVVGQRSATKYNLGGWIDRCSKFLTSLITRTKVQETKGDAINIFKVSSLAPHYPMEGNLGENYFYPLLLDLISRNKSILYTAMDNGINYKSRLKLNLKRFFFVLKTLISFSYKKLTCK